MREIHDLVYHGGGGFNYFEVWQMPIMTRKLHIRWINQFLEEKNKAEQEASRQSSVPSGKVQMPDFMSKVPKK